MVHANKLRQFKVYGVVKGENVEKYLGTFGMVCTPLYGESEAKKMYRANARKIRVVEFDNNNQ